MDLFSQEPEMIETEQKSEKLEKLKKEISGCKNCKLSQGRNGVVFGEGNPEAKLVLCGEGPGAEEDRLLRPFVGRAGMLLDKILAACGFSRFEHVFILNIVKCRPPGNRIPDDEEVRACFPHLKRQLSIIQPKIVVLLGATAMKSLINPNARITKERGVWVYKSGIWFMPTYHPAALLRNPALKRDAWEDFKNVVAKYRELVDSGHKSPYC